jgi:flavorubredoxin
MIKTAKEIGFDVYEPGVEVKFVPDGEDLKKCFEFGQQIAQKIKV